MLDGSEEARYADDPQVCSLIAAARERFGDAVEAIVLYGSFTRGEKDTLLDLYILLRDFTPLPGWQGVLGRMLAPNVYQLKTELCRAKVAVMTFDQLEKSVRSDVTPYFWARFAQPTTLLYQVDETVAERYAQLVTQAAERLVAAAALGGAGMMSSQDFWIHTFSHTYDTELRSERSSRYETLYRANAPYFDALHAAYAGLKQPPQTSWAIRKLTGKLLSVLRLCKSSLTFDDPVDYALWKVQRHSGVTVTPTERQRRYPLIFAWPLVWQLYRQGALK
jgi:predicted nucleotidyltransferase